MRRFARLFADLDATNATRAKERILAEYFAAAPAADAAWALHVLSGGKIARAIPTRLLRELGARAAGIPDWLFEGCYDAVGDLAETVAHLLPPPALHGDLPLSTWIEERLLPLRALPASDQARAIAGWWNELAVEERLVWNKLLTGGFRVGVSRGLVTRALAQAHGIEAALVAQRLMGDWQPSAERYAALISGEDGAASLRPYPFLLAHALDQDPAALGDPSDWIAEWKWDGLRAQLVCRDAQTQLWSRGDELITARFPEILTAARVLPQGCVLDGEVLAWRDGAPLPFALLQTRIGRRNPGARSLAQAPAVFIAYDLLEIDGVDIRQQPLRVRRATLERLLTRADDALMLSPLLAFEDWNRLLATRDGARERGVEGVMLKRAASAYGVGRPRGDWWKWKVAPHSVDAVLVYAQRGHGRRASLYTDYTFAVWDGAELVPFAKAYSGLTDAEIRTVDRFVRANTQEKFGPVRSVKPALVCEIAFEGIQASKRHRSGVAVRFPRILRLREDKRIEEADRLDSLKALLA